MSQQRPTKKQRTNVSGLSILVPSQTTSENKQPEPVQQEEKKQKEERPVHLWEKVGLSSLDDYKNYVVSILHELVSEWSDFLERKIGKVDYHENYWTSSYKVTQNQMRHDTNLHNNLWQFTVNWWHLEPATWQDSGDASWLLHAVNGPSLHHTVMSRYYTNNYKSPKLNLRQITRHMVMVYINHWLKTNHREVRYAQEFWSDDNQNYLYDMRTTHPISANRLKALDNMQKDQALKWSPLMMARIAENDPNHIIYRLPTDN